MASRFAKTALGATRVRPTALPLRSFAPTTFATTAAPKAETPKAPQVPQKDPKSTAESFLDALPGNSRSSKAAILSAGTGLSAVAISNELFVVNEEAIVMVSLLTIYWALYNYLGPMYRSWADGMADKYKNILNAAREHHTNAVKARIGTVKDLSGVIDITKDLFAVSKETAQLEAQAYEMEQKTALVSEAKNVLDSWVRYEAQVKQKQQAELAQTVIARVEKELKDPKVLEQILKQSVADVERIVAKK
ncbi:hypothetical protein K470DRAFT_278985 [Piedraia hortae CBS 480.64]|uniref:ATP synthase subunit 4 n=1 Tax=Piedraia hortae CBS 480.64 TaxID=1314780 RepID=A0A6A7BT26_9PEZI|nr:hypothetical protein K470DRAFT_278985 [Piedraia hortae CBS 480.64]